MPTIAVPNYSAVAHAAGGASIDAQAAGAPFGALAQAGGQIANSGQLLGQIAMQRQEHVNAGILANEDTIRRNTYAEVQEYAEKNQGTPETWDAFAKQKFQDYKDGVAARSQADGWGPDVKERDGLEAKQFFSRADIMFDADRSKALVRQANGRFEANADIKMQSGDWQGAVAEVGKMNLPPEARDAKVRQVISTGIYRNYDRRLTDVGTLTNVGQLEGFAEIEVELANPKTAVITGEDGKEIGGLDQNARIDLIRQTRARMKAVNLDMAQAGQALVRQANRGVDPSLAFRKAMDSGEITPEVAAVFVPEAADALAVRKVEAMEKAALRAEREDTRRDKAERQVESVIDNPRGATITLEEIERREAIGITRPNDPTGLTKEAASRLRERLTAVEEGDAETPEFFKVNDQLETKLGQGVFRTWFSDSAQMSPAEKSRTLEKINAAKVSTGAKLKLMDKFFEVQKWDLREGEITDRDGDRNIGPEEKDLRTAMIEHYRKVGRELGPRAIGARYMADMQQITDWFSNNESASESVKQAKSREFYETMRKSVDNEASTSILRTIPIFQ